MTKQYKIIMGERQSEISLRKICEKRAEEIYGENLPGRIRDRINLEMLFIHKKNMADTFLELSNLLQTVCNSENSHYEKGFRGALGASFVAFLCGLTPFNPMEIKGMNFYPEMFFKASFPRFVTDETVPVYINLSRSFCEKLNQNSVHKEEEGGQKYFFYETRKLTLLEELQKATNDTYKTEIWCDDMRILPSLFDKITEPVGQRLGYGLPGLDDDAVAIDILKNEGLDFEVLVKSIGLSHGQGTWINNAEHYRERGLDIRETIACAEDVYEFLLEYGCHKKVAFQLMEKVRKGTETLSESDIQTMEELEIPQWFIDSCLKIQYLFYRPQLVCYALEYVRLAYYGCRQRRKYRYLLNNL